MTTKIEDLKGTMDTLVSEIQTQNGLIKDFSVLAFRVNILWKVFIFVCTVIGLGVTGLIGKAMLGD